MPDFGIRAKWAWNWEVQRIWICVLFLTSIAMSLGFYSVFGPYSLFFLLLSLVGVIFAVINGIVGKKVRSLRESLSTRGGEVVESLIVDGNIQPPGVSVMMNSELVLAPIIGNLRTIQLEDIESFRETTWFNGKKLLWKKGFFLNISGYQRIGFAIPETIGRLWADRLTKVIRERNS